LAFFGSTFTASLYIAISDDVFSMGAEDGGGGAGADPRAWDDMGEGAWVVVPESWQAARKAKRPRNATMPTVMDRTP
jgi:hypothetical protein